MPLNQDSKIIFLFYGFIIFSMCLGWIWLDRLADRTVATYIHFTLGLSWAASGIWVARDLQKIYDEPFREMALRKKRSILMAILVASFGLFVVVWSGWQWL